MALPHRKHLTYRDSSIRTKRLYSITLLRMCRNFLTFSLETEGYQGRLITKTPGICPNWGVRCSYRGMGIAWELVRLRMLQVIDRGYTQYFMRTASVGSNSIPMYMKSGSIPVSQQQDVSSTEQATENHTQSLQRVYLWGDCMESARKIEEIRHQKNYPLLDSSQ